MDEKTTIRGFREFKGTKDSPKLNYPHPFLATVVQTITISSSDCEWSFSTINNKVTKKKKKCFVYKFLSTVSDLLFSCSNQMNMLRVGLKEIRETQMKKTVPNDSSYQHLWILLIV